MNTKTILVNTATNEKARRKVLIIYTGGTFGMAHDKDGVLIPFLQILRYDSVSGNRLSMAIALQVNLLIKLNEYSVPFASSLFRLLT